MQNDIVHSSHSHLSLALFWLGACARPTQTCPWRRSFVRDASKRCGTPLSRCLHWRLHCRPTHFGPDQSALSRDFAVTADPAYWFMSSWAEAKMIKMGRWFTQHLWRLKLLQGTTTVLRPASTTIPTDRFSSAQQHTFQQGW